MNAPVDPDRLLAALRDAVDLSAARPVHVVVHASDADVLHVIETVVGAGHGRVTAVTGVGTDLADLRSVVREHGADAAAVLDGDRLQMLDDAGVPVPPSTVLTVVALRLVAAELRAGRVPLVVRDHLTSRAVQDLLEAAGAATVAVHAADLPERAAADDAVVGGDAEGRLLLRGAPNGTGAVLGLAHVLAELGGQPHPLSLLAELYQPYAAVGPLVLGVADADAAVARVVDAYVTNPGGGPVETDERDGLLVSHWGAPPPWWFAVRYGDGGLRLTVEAADEDVLDKVRDDVVSLLTNEEDR